MRVGVIGCGRWGKNAARTVDNARELAWVCDSDPAASAHLGKLFGARVVDEPAWADCDAVWLATPIETHEVMAHEAMSRGKHVLGEKPVARTKAAALGLVEHAARAGVTLCADHTWLGHAGLRAKIDHARAARCIKYEATRLAFDTRDFDALEDMLPHDTALARHAFKRDVTRVIVPAAERRVILDFGGHHAQATYRYDVQNKVRKVEVWAADASYAADGGELPEGAPEPLSVIYEEFAAAIRERRDPTIGSPAEFIHVAAVIEAAKQSRERGGEWVDVDR